ncbi:MAG: hypothetical protein K6B41_03610 [Butyrivibrio sp.]|nr:hypothetical protein [Butyrivibrio sp.]
MVRSEILSKKISLQNLNLLIDTGHVYYFPFALNRTAYIVVNGKPSMVIVSDVSIKGIQLSGCWYSWEELDALGGVYDSEFEALTAIANGTAKK